MICKRCNSINTIIQAVTETRTKSEVYFTGYFLLGLIDILLWIFFTIPRLIIALFRSRKVTSKTTTQAVYQTCGNR